jgi:hypothetical protein
LREAEITRNTLAYCGKAKMTKKKVYDIDNRDSTTSPSPFPATPADSSGSYKFIQVKKF